MKSSKLLALSAITLLGFSACQKPELESELTSGATHTVTFVAGAPETKTTVDISDGTTAKFAWTKDDEGRIAIYENGVAATTVVCGLDDKTGKMTIMAEFKGTATGNETYVAVVNSSNDGQIMSAEAYDEDADILVSKAVSAFDGENGVLLQFKREVAIAKMTLKGLDAGEVVNHVTVSSIADIAGSYGVDGWNSKKTSLDIYSAKALDDQETYSIAANQSGEAVVWFTCIPQDAATLTVKVEAADGDTYTKEFSKPITLTRGDVKGFGVAMEKDAKVTPSYTIEFNSTAKTVTDISNTTKATTFVVSGSDYLTEQPASNYSKAYYGGSTDGLPLRIGTSSAAGKITLALSEAGQVPATKIILSAKQYSSGKTKVIGVNGSDKQQPGDDYTDLNYDLDGTTISSITLDTDGYIYVKSITVEYGGTIKTALATPTNLAVSAEKVVSWDAVDGAASYVLTIGTEEYPCTSNSYEASAIADEYYDVAVVAVPSDTESHKNSAAATLTDAKFGTPTLATPELQEGAVDEFSVNTTWTVDPRATAGYNCELYNGETKVGDSKNVNSGSVTFDGLDDGVTYTVKVNAIAVEGTKAYAASAVKTIDLTTKGTTKISDINAAGTYTVKNAVVFAVANTGVVIIGDGTGLMLLSKSSHGYAVGDTFSTVAGKVAESNGIWQFNDPTVGTKTSGSAPNYGIAVEATSDYLASKPNKVEYVHARGSQSGRYITVGTEKLYMSKANTTNDGKDVDAYGFIYGYSTQYSNTNFCVTSIAEDPTAPKLSVTPTSKTWASDETDAAVFTVKTNTEGEKDWSVSPETLGWATIAVDKTAGTITVTPNGANTAETAREATLTVTHSSGTLSETITLTQKTSSQNESYEVSGTLASWAFTSGNYPANKTNYKNNGNNDLATGTFYLNGTGSQWNTPKGYAFTAVTDITITVTATNALKKGAKITFSMDTYYNKASNAPMKGFNLTAAEGEATASTTGLSVTSFSLSTSSATKSVDYTLQNDVSAGSTVKLILTQTGKAGAGQGYINNIKAEYTAE